MLVAKLREETVEAGVAERGFDYRCGGCNGALVLKKGRIVIHHFAHKPPTDCKWAKGETKAHLEAKKVVVDALKGRGLKANAEFVVDTLPGDRRADVMTWRPDGQMVAIELQHTSISLDEIEKRAFSYARASIAQMWIPFLHIRPGLDVTRTSVDTGLLVSRYSPRPFEIWVHGLNGKDGLWMYSPRDHTFWVALLQAHEIYVEESNWHGEGGEEMSSGGYYRDSKRFRDLSLTGPYKIDDLRIKLKPRRRFSLHQYNWPEGKIASFTPMP